MSGEGSGVKVGSAEGFEGVLGVWKGVEGVCARERRVATARSRVRVRVTSCLALHIQGMQIHLIVLKTANPNHDALLSFSENVRPSRAERPDPGSPYQMSYGSLSRLLRAHCRFCV